MKAFFILALVTSLSTSLISAAASAADEDQAKLQGKWMVESFEYNGNPIDIMKDATREFKETKYTLTPKNGDVIEGVVKLDASKKPKEIDLEVNGRTLRGIYEVDGETLKMSYTINDGERPTEFVSKPDSGVVLVVHKRAK